MLKPITPVYLVTKKQITLFESKDITTDTVGEKAFGLSCLFSKWTLPFFVISKNLFIEFQKTNIISEEWKKIIIEALDLINNPNEIIVRSCAAEEGISERGKYLSINTPKREILKTIKNCYSSIKFADKKIELFLIIQEYIKPVAFGHVSNERRLYYEKRDWMIEYELPAINSESLNLRKWREEIDLETEKNKKLKCN